LESLLLVIANYARTHCRILRSKRQSPLSGGLLGIGVSMER
jgi:hypothetical protein